MRVGFLILLLQIPIISGFFFPARPAEFSRTVFDGRPELEFYWEAPPDIRICNTSAVRPVDVRRATGYWERLGYRFGNIIVDDTSPSCLGVPQDGEILIMEPESGFDFSKIAGTMCAVTTGTRSMAYAKIYMQNRHIRRPRVLEHEIGHALGWLHSASSYHIMNAEWESGGSGSSGVGSFEYIRRSEELRKVNTN